MRAVDRIVEQEVVCRHNFAISLVGPGFLATSTCIHKSKTNTFAGKHKQVIPRFVDFCRGLDMLQ